MRCEGGGLLAAAQAVGRHLDLLKADDQSTAKYLNRISVQHAVCFLSPSLSRSTALPPHRVDPHPDTAKTSFFSL